MIDIHCHILPGLDDGAASIEESLKIAQELVTTGFSKVIATPHVLEGIDYITPAQIKEKVHELNQVFQQERIPLQVLPGAENYIFPDLVQWFQQGKILTLADTQKYILVELPRSSIPPYTEQVFFDLQILGITPVLAHPERNSTIILHPERMVAWVEKGILLQVDLRSFKRTYGSKAQAMAEDLLNSGMIHFVGSDLHRGSEWGHGLNIIMRKIEEFSTHKLVAATSENPEHILMGQYFVPERSEQMGRIENRSKKRDWLQVPFGRG